MTEHRGSPTGLLTAVVVAGLTVAAGAHLGVAAGHGAELLGGLHGAFFAVVGVTQAVLALAVLQHPRPFLRPAAALSLAIVVVWAAARVGVIGSAEAPGPADLAATVAELVTVVAAVAAHRRLAAGAPGRRAGIPASAAVLGVVVVLSGSVAVADPHGDHHHRGGHAPAASAEHVDVFGDLFDHHPVDLAPLSPHRPARAAAGE